MFVYYEKHQPLFKFNHDSSKLFKLRSARPIIFCLPPTQYSIWILYAYRKAYRIYELLPWNIVQISYRYLQVIDHLTYHFLQLWKQISPCALCHRYDQKRLFSTYNNQFTLSQQIKYISFLPTSPLLHQ